MNTSLRKRNTKWDLKESPVHPLHSMKENEYLEQKNGIDKEISTGSIGWNAGRDYSAEMSPGLDDWRKQNHPCSPRIFSSSGRKSGCRSRSRSKDRYTSRSRSRSRTRSWRSRSRSRGWSRSPEHRFRREIVINNRERKRFKVFEDSNEICRDFSAGRCTRSNRCLFVHRESNDFENKRHTDVGRLDRGENKSNIDRASDYSTLNRECEVEQGRTEGCIDFLRGYCKRGNSCKYTHDISVGGWKKEGDGRIINASSEQYLRVGSVLCKFYAAGNCRNGNSCRFSHHRQPFSNLDMSDEKKWRMEEDVDNLGRIDGSTEWNDSGSLTNTASMNVAGSGKPLSTEKTVNNLHTDHRRDNYLENRIDHSVGNIDNASMVLSHANYSLQSSGDNHISEIGIPNLSGRREWLDDMDDFPEWNFEDQSQKNVAETLKHLNNGSEYLMVAKSSLPVHEPHEVQVTSGQRNSTDPIIQPLHIEGSLFLQNPSSRLEDCPAANNPRPPFTQNSANIVALETSFNQDVYTVGRSLPSVNVVGQEQSVLVSPLKQLLPTYDTQNHAQLEMEPKCPVYNDTTPQTNTGILLPQSGVHSEQLAQLTEISASLAQLLRGKQLPQIYAALNAAIQPQSLPLPSNSTVDLTPPSTICVKSSSTIEPRKQYDPLCDSIEPTTPGQPNVSASLMDDTGVMKQTEQVVVCEVNENNRDINPDIRGMKDQPGNDPSSCFDGKHNSVEGRKNMDPKAARTFKFALAEFVKDLLKPSWKYGKINREIYKTIVKKVVDKVIASVNGTHIPQTQETIDQYLSFSKPKLAKLVEAYVGMHQK